MTTRENPAPQQQYYFAQSDYQSQPIAKKVQKLPLRWISHHMLAGGDGTSSGTERWHGKDEKNALNQKLSPSTVAERAALERITPARAK